MNLGTSIRHISHLGLAVRDLEASVAFYRDVLGLELLHREVVADQQVETVMFRVGEAAIELLAPTSPASPVARFLDRRGEGVHHVAYAVADLPAALAAAAAGGVELIDSTPRPGAGGRRIAFLHPRSTFGVLTELCDDGEPAPPRPPDVEPAPPRDDGEAAAPRPPDVEPAPPRDDGKPAPPRPPDVDPTS